jgi:methylamine utilization protein MauE
MNPALGPFAIAAVLLVLAGALKATQPDDTTRALRGAGLPARRPVVRVGGAVEAALGLLALVAVDPVVAVLVVVSYALFGAFVIVALAKRLPIATCGCFGKVDAPPTLVHVGLSLGAVAFSVAMAVDTALSPVDLLEQRWFEAAAYVLLVLIGTLSAFVAMTWLPRALRAAPR